MSYQRGSKVQLNSGEEVEIINLFETTFSGLCAKNRGHKLSRSMIGYSDFLKYQHNYCYYFYYDINKKL